jgi:hypothetical protein
LRQQIENKYGYRNGVAVRLYSKKMTDNAWFGISNKNPLKYHRVWMDAEYDVITPREAKQLKKKWDS